MMTSKGIQSFDLITYLFFIIIHQMLKKEILNRTFLTKQYLGFQKPNKYQKRNEEIQTIIISLLNDAVKKMMEMMKLGTDLSRIIKLTNRVAQFTCGFLPQVSQLQNLNGFYGHKMQAIDYKRQPPITFTDKIRRIPFENFNKLNSKRFATFII